MDNNSLFDMPNPMTPATPDSFGDARVPVAQPAPSKRIKPQNQYAANPGSMIGAAMQSAGIKPGYQPGYIPGGNPTGSPFGLGATGAPPMQTFVPGGPQVSPMRQPMQTSSPFASNPFMPRQPLLY